MVVVFVYFPTRTLVLLICSFESFRMGKVRTSNAATYQWRYGVLVVLLSCNGHTQKSIDSITMPPAGAPKPTSARNEDEEPPQCRGVDISSLCAGSRHVDALCGGYSKTYSFFQILCIPF